MKQRQVLGLGIGGLAAMAGLVMYIRSQSMTNVFAESAKASAAKSQAAAVAAPSKPSPASQGSAPAATNAQPADTSKNDESKKDGKIAYTFQTDEAMRQFAALSQQRQGILLRLSVLRAYAGEEQANLMELDQRFAKEYGLDVTKSYMLDSRRRVLIEQEAPPPAPTAPATPVAPSVSGKP